jgi:hypothetical protein
LFSFAHDVLQDLDALRRCREKPSDWCNEQRAAVAAALGTPNASR